MQKVVHLLCVKLKLYNVLLHRRLPGFWNLDYHLRGGGRCYAVAASPTPVP